MVLAVVKKPALGFVIAAVLMTVGAVFYFRSGSADKSAVRYDTVPAERGPIIAKVTASGTLSALVTVQVGSQVSGRLKEILVDFNSQVKKDEVIARIDPQIFEANLAQARANHLAARANLRRSEVQVIEMERQYERTKTLGARNLIAQAEVDTAEANRDSAKAQVEASRAAVAQSEASLKQSQVNLGYTTIVSPINGVVISRSVDVGQTVAASLQAPTLFIIAEDLRKMQVNTSVAEADIGRLEAGMDATFVVDAYPNDRFRGTVRQIRNAPTTTQNVVTYDAVIDVENPELKLRPGMTANVTFIYAKVDDGIRVPNAALRFRPPTERKTAAPAGAKTVYVLDGDRPRAVVVKTGVSDGSVTEIKEGLEEGQLVITNAPSGPGTGGSQQRQRNPFRGL
jgi:HlyD family secretion protein